jgi:hypothetical protein
VGERVAETRYDALPIGGDNAVYESQNSGGWVDLGGYAKRISAGLPIGYGSTAPSVYMIGLNDNVSVNFNNTQGWTDGGGYALEISSPSINAAGWSIFNFAEVFAVGRDHGEYHHGSSGGWTNLGPQLL